MSLIQRNGKWYLADREYHHRSPSKHRYDKTRSTYYEEKKKEHRKIAKEAFLDVGCSNLNNLPGIPQKGELVSRSNSPMFDIHPGEVLVRKRGPTVIYRHPYW